MRLNLTDGLAESITLQYNEYVIEQPLDYELLPFRCHRCHKYGHLVRDCLMGRRRRRTQSREEEREGSWRHEVKPMAGSAPNEISLEEPLHQSAEEQPQEDGIPVHPSDVQLNLEPPPADPVVVAEVELPSMQSPPTISAFNSESIVGDSPLFKNCNDVMQKLENLSVDMPSILNCEDIPPVGQGAGSSSVARHYNLRSLSKKLVGSNEIMESVGG